MVFPANHSITGVRRRDVIGFSIDGGTMDLRRRRGMSPANQGSPRIEPSQYGHVLSPASYLRRIPTVYTSVSTQL
jgi:hypothetical protein